MLDLGCSLVLLAVLTLLASAYGVRAALWGGVRFERLEQAGASVLLGQGPMRMMYWGLEPLARVCVRAGLTANGVTSLSLLFGLGAGAALAGGHFGVAAVATAVATLGDALDGLVARASGTSSSGGETFDAAADRYGEFFFLGGLALFYRGSEALLLLVLLALLGGWMVSYGTAKAEALHVEPPRGAMRRAERALYLWGGAVLVPLARVAFPAPPYPRWAGEGPILAALALVAIVANVSAVRRLRAVARAADGALGGETPPVDDPSLREIGS